MSWLQDVDDKFDKLKVGTFAWRLLSVVCSDTGSLCPRQVLNLIGSQGYPWASDPPASCCVLGLHALHPTSVLCGTADWPQVFAKQVPHHLSCPPSHQAKRGLPLRVERQLSNEEHLRSHRGHPGSIPSALWIHVQFQFSTLCWPRQVPCTHAVHMHRCRRNTHL